MNLQKWFEESRKTTQGPWYITSEGLRIVGGDPLNKVILQSLPDAPGMEGHHNLMFAVLSKKAVAEAVELLRKARAVADACHQYATDEGHRRIQAQADEVLKATDWVDQVGAG